MEAFMTLNKKLAKNRKNVENSKVDLATVEEVQVHTLIQMNTQRVCLWRWTRSMQPEHHTSQRFRGLSCEAPFSALKTSLGGWFCSRSASTEPSLYPFSCTYFLLRLPNWDRPKKKEQEDGVKKKQGRWERE